MCALYHVLHGWTTQWHTQEVWPGSGYKYGPLYDALSCSDRDCRERQERTFPSLTLGQSDVSLSARLLALVLHGPPQGTHCIRRWAHQSSLHNHCLHHTSSSAGYSDHCYTWTGRACRSCWHSARCLHLSYPGSRSPSRTARTVGCIACWHTATRWTHTGDALQTGGAFGYKPRSCQEWECPVHTGRV